MTAIPRPFSNEDISDRLTAPLRQVAHRQRVMDASVATLKTTIAGAIAIMAAAMLLGYFSNLWMPVRVAIAVITWALVVAAGIRFLRPLLRRRTLSHAALRIEREFPELHERLSSAVEIAGESNPAFRGSPELVAHLFRQAERDADAVEPQRVVPADRVVFWAVLAAPVLIGWMVLLLAPPTMHTALGGLYRVLMPWKNALPDVLCEVVVKPGDVAVVQGDAIDITTHLSFGSVPDAGSPHATLVRRFAGGLQLTDAMESSSPRDYDFHLADVQESFSYRVQSDRGDSPWFTAAVHPRPKVAGVTIRCDYPAYTALPPTTVDSPDGAIRALVGTRVTLTVHATSAVSVGKSAIAVDYQLAADNESFPLTQRNPANLDYQAQFTVNRSGQYRINLTNDFNLSNTDERPRSLIAVSDKAPKIAIRSPEPKATVGMQDIVPVQYTATDDFAVRKIEALVWVDNLPEQTFAVDFKTADPTLVTGPPFMLSVADCVQASGVVRAQIITYQLRATDNRDGGPDQGPQIGLSAKQVLSIDHNDARNFENRDERRRGEELNQAIQKAINQLTEAQSRVAQTRDADARQPLEDWRKRQLHEAAEQVPATIKNLKAAADDASGTALADVARQVRQIADKPLQAGAEDTAKADLSSDKPQDRRDNAKKAVDEIIAARDQLQKILLDSEVQKAEQQAEAARDLTDAAAKQQEAADLMKAQSAPTPQTPKEQRKQQEQQQQAMRDEQQANQKLQQAMQQSEALRDPQATEEARKLEDLIRKVDDLQKQQETADKQTQKQQAAIDVQQNANAVAKQQEALNQQIQKSADDHRNPLQKAGANVPNHDQQQNIVRSLNQNNLQQAHQQMQQAANQLHQEAQQLQNLAKSNTLQPGNHERDELDHDQHDAEAAQHQQQQADQAADDLKKADPAKNADAIDQAKRTAGETAKLAAETPPRNEAARKSSAAAEQDAKAAQDAADKAAHAADPQEAQKDLAEAARDLHQAGQEAAAAAKENAAAHHAEMVKAQQHDAQSAAEDAQKQADQQAALARAIEGDQQALAKVQNQPDPDRAAHQQDQIAQQAHEAEQQARELQKQAEQTNDPEMQVRAAQARADLKDAQTHAAAASQSQGQAASEQHEAANTDNAEHAHAAEQNAQQHLQQANGDQQHAAAALAKAEAELRNLPQADGNPQHPDVDPQTAANGQQPNAQQQQQAARAAQEAAQAQQEAMQQQNPQAAQQAARALNQAAKAMAQATPGMHPGEPENGPPGNDPGKQQTASSNPGKSSDPSKGIQASPASVQVPGAVLDIGITADQWAHLPPLAKKDLMNAAQQSGPPGYRQMTKDYYAKIAKLQDSAGK